MYTGQRAKKKGYTPIVGEDFEEDSQASSEGGYHGLPFSLNANPADIQWQAMSKESGNGVPRPVTFADQDLTINQHEKSPAPSNFSDSFEQSLKSVSDYDGGTDGQFSFVSTVGHGVSPGVVCERFS